MRQTGTLGDAAAQPKSHYGSEGWGFESLRARKKSRSAACQGWLRTQQSQHCLSERLGGTAKAHVRGLIWPLFPSDEKPTLALVLDGRLRSQPGRAGTPSV
jgi:hypothetical protein